MLPNVEILVAKRAERPHITLDGIPTFSIRAAGVGEIGETGTRREAAEGSGSL